MTRDEKERFADDFLRLYLANGLGSLPKTEIDVLVFHLLGRTKDYTGKSNYELATALKLPEARIKTLRLHSALKYESLNSKAILGRILLRLRDGKQFANIEGTKLEISLEDPVEKRELENSLKTRGHYAEYSFNSEVLKIAPLRLFELIMENMDNADKVFNQLVRENLEDKDASERVLEGAPSLKQKLGRLRKETMTLETLGALLGGAASAFGV